MHYKIITSQRRRLVINIYFVRVFRYFVTSSSVEFDWCRSMVEIDARVEVDGRDRTHFGYTRL